MYFIRADSASPSLNQNNQNIIGPYNTQQLIELFKLNLIDGLTYINPDYHTNRNQWTTLSNYTPIKNLLISTDEPDESENENDPTETQLDSIEHPNNITDILLTGNPDTSRSATQTNHTDLNKTISDKSINNIESTDSRSPIHETPTDLEQTIGPLHDGSTSRDLPLVELPPVRPKASRPSSDRGGRTEGGPLTSVYVWNLPCGITEEELVNHMKRCGVIRLNPMTLNPQVKIYDDDERGSDMKSGLVVYVKSESVDLAIRYLDRSMIDNYPDVEIRVEVASFDHKKKNTALVNLDGTEYRTGNMDQKKMKKRRLGARMEESRMLSWGDDGVVGGSSGGRVLTLSPCWTSDHAEMYRSNSKFYDYIIDLIERQLKLLNTSYKKIFPIRRHPKGIVCIKMSSEIEAEKLISICKIQNIKLSPLVCHPDYSDDDAPTDTHKDEHSFLPIYYDGRTDLSAFCIPEDNNDPSQYSGDNLYAIDRLWLASAGLPSHVIFPPITADGPHDGADGPHDGATRGGADITASTVEKEGDMNNVERFGDWLEEQSSDEEFDIKEETT